MADVFRSEIRESFRDELAARRLAQLPRIQYDSSLPVVERREEIARAIREHPVVILCGETGSGKSTQLPKICLELGRGIHGMIGHTQPRRIAARSVAARIAQELGSPLGQVVGYKIRFTDETRLETSIKVMTDGVLLAETQTDRNLARYDTIILDEAHERSLNIDFLLGYLKRLLPRRPDLRLIITSATLDADRFATHFAAAGDPTQPAPVIQVEGRTYPVDIQYRPWTDLEGADAEPDAAQHLSEVVAEAIAAGPGDILVFLPTERDILEASHVLRGRWSGQHGVEVLPLYARLSTSEQQRVFEPHRQRRVVLATNVAESSLTVPGIRFVVDLGTARISRFSARGQVQRLPIEPISQAAANQRAGRCGRVGPGICYRLYSEEDFQGRDPFTSPEIRRANLASVILRTSDLRLGRLEEFPFLDPPRPSAIQDGYRLLRELGAVDEEGELTPLGSELSRLPVDPRIGRMLLAARDDGCLREVLVIAAALEVQDPRIRPVDKQQAADEAHSRHAHGDSDFLAWLNLWNFYHDLKERLSRNQLRKACQQNFLSPSRMREWTDIHLQLQEMMGSSDRQRRSGGATEADAARYGRIHRTLLTGLLGNVAMRMEDHSYQGAGGQTLYLWPGAGPAPHRPAWIMAAEIVETSRRFARCVARIDPAWIEPLAGHVVKRSYSEPHWSRKAGATMAFEKVTLWGLPLVIRRRVAYGRIDPVVSRELMIRDGLATGEFDSAAPYWRHNQQLLVELEAEGTKARRSAWFIDHYARARFYESRLPPDVFDAARLEKWRKAIEREQPRILHMSREDLLPEDADTPTAEAFPDTWEATVTDEVTVPLPLRYQFAPGTAEDGITVSVPREGLGHVRDDQLSWLVPGLLEEKIIALIRSLPKAIRRNCVPAPERARQVAAALEFGQGNLEAAVARELSRLTGERITAADFRTESLPPHLKMNVRVHDDAGKTLASDRDVPALRRRLGVTSPSIQAASVAGTRTDPRWERRRVTSWDFGDWPEQLLVTRGKLSLPMFPGLVDDRDSVSLRLFERPELAQWESRGGIRRLVVISERRALQAQADWLPDIQKLAILMASRLSSTAFREQVLELLADRAFLADGKLPRTAAEFQQLIARGRERCDLAAGEVGKLLGPLVRGYHEVQLQLTDRRQERFLKSRTDVENQVAKLVTDRFLLDHPWEWLRQVPRYLQAARLRLEKLPQNLAKDEQQLAALQPFLKHLAEEADAHLPPSPDLVSFRWMVEEMRVSLFAQSLGTSISISFPRLEKQWQKVVSRGQGA